MRQNLSDNTHSYRRRHDPLSMIRSSRRALLGLLAAMALLLTDNMTAQASIGFYIGKNLTEDGSVILARYGDEPSSHWVEIVPRKHYPSDARIKVGATPKALYPGQLIEIPQVPETCKYITSNYSAYAGFPAPLTNGGLNEHHVAARDIWSPSRSELQQMTPKPQRGLNYSDLSRIVMERAHTAREAVQIVGSLIDRYGFCTYGGNSHMFADSNEGWVLINFAGGQGLWIAQRLGPDTFRVSHPGYILEIPLDFQKNPNYMGSKNFISFAVQQGWYDPQSGKPFNVNQIYGDAQGRAEAVVRLEAKVAQLAPHVRVKDLMAILRTTALDSSGYGQIAHLRTDRRKQLGILWVAPASPLTAPFIPLRLGMTDVPPEYKRHRYLTEDEAAAFMDPNYRGLESTRYAFRACKRLFYLVHEHRDKFQNQVVDALTAFENKLISQQELVERTARTLYQAGQDDLARHYLTYYGKTEALKALRLVEALSQSIELQTKVLFDIRQPDTTEGHQ